MFDPRPPPWKENVSTSFFFIPPPIITDSFFFLSHSIARNWGEFDAGQEDIKASKHIPLQLEKDGLLFLRNNGQISGAIQSLLLKKAMTMMKMTTTTTTIMKMTTTTMVTTETNAATRHRGYQSVFLEKWF